MNKILTKKYLNYMILFLSIILYFFLMFISDIDLGTGKKELENIIVLAMPCFITFFYSLNIKNPKERKQIIIIYTFFYILALLGFTFANFRDNILIDEGIIKREHNIIPFQSIAKLLSSPLGIQFALYNIIGNFLMLTPFSILLPLINDKFKNNKNYSLVIITIGLLIEITQYITKTGSFDIDDIILNLTGAYLVYLLITKTKLYTYLYNLFYKITIPTKIFKIIYYILIIITIFIYLLYISLINQNIKENKVDFSNLTCIENTKTYLGTIGKYNYYSECKYEGFIIKGNEKIYPEDIIKKMSSEINNYQKELKLIKEKSITNVKVELSKNTRKIIYESENTKIHLVDIEKISYNKNGNECLIDNYIIESDDKCGSLYALVTVTLEDLPKGYVIQEGEFYNILSCVEGQYPITYINDYILPKKYKIDKNSCSNLNKSEPKH